MTALCPSSGPSGPQSGVGGVIALSSVAIDAFLTALGFGEISTLISGFLGAIVEIDVSSYCSADPPADPMLTSTDIANAILLSQPSISLPAQAKVAQWFLSRYWWQICQCTSGTTPSPPTLSNPGGASTNPGLPGGSNQPCFSGSATDNNPVPASGNVIHDLTGMLLPVGSGSLSVTHMNIDGTINLSGTAWDIPATITSIQINASATQFDSTLPGANVMAVNWNTFDSSGNLIDSQILCQALSGDTALTNNIVRGGPIWNSSATYFAIASMSQAISGHTGALQGITLTSTCSCNGNGLQEGCCPPDPSIEAKLDQIIGLVTSLYQGAPTALTSYAAGSAHTGLSGDGTISIATDAIAIQVEITTDPGFYGMSAGFSNYLYDRGYVVPVISTFGPIAGQNRLVYAEQMLILPALTDEIGYSLAAGVVVTITELTAGP